MHKINIWNELPYSMPSEQISVRQKFIEALKDMGVSSGISFYGCSNFLKIQKLLGKKGFKYRQFIRDGDIADSAILFVVSFKKESDIAMIKLALPELPLYRIESA
jgi:hypothetical protein